MRSIVNKIGMVLGFSAGLIGIMGVVSLLWTLVELLTWAYTGDTIIINPANESTAGPIFTSLFASVVMVLVGILGGVMVDEFYVNE